MDDIEFLKSCKNLHKRVRTPTVIQMEFVECGAASLSMMLGHYKRFCTLEELRIACAVSSNGVEAGQIIRGGKCYGLLGKAFKKTIQKLVEVEPPFIIYWNFNHFLVLEGFSKKGVYLNDPACGPRIVTFEDFCHSYTGIVITFQKTEEFKPGGSPPSVLNALKTRIVGLASTFVFLGITQACLLIPGLATVAFTQIFIDNIFIEHKLEWKWYLIFSIMTSMFLSIFLNWARGKCIYKMNAKVSIRLSSQFFFYILKLPLNFYQQRSSGDLAYRLQLNDTVINIITEQLSRVVLNLLLIGVYGSIMFYFSFWIGLIAVVEAIVNIIILAWINRKRTDAMSKVLQTNLQMIGYSVGGLQSIETIKSLGLEADFFSKWANTNTAFLTSNQEYGSVNIFLSVITPLFNGFCSALTVTVGALLVMKGSLSIGMLMALQSISGNFVGPLMELVELGKSLQQTKIDLLRLDDSLNNAVDPRFATAEPMLSDAESIDKLTGALSIKDISFGYSKATDPIVENISFDIQPGKIVALLGPTDAGKTTIATMAAGLYDPWAGEVLYDGKTRNHIPATIFKDSIAIVDQTINLFPGSIRDNLTLWNIDISEETIVEAAKDACIHDQIITREKGYKYEMKEQGIDFSGGERQRFEIARAFITKPSLLILDEALNGLDIETEKTILRNVKKRGCACLIVTNRLSAIRLCDEIIVVDRGAVLQKGTHHTLKNEEGFYKQVILAGGKIQ